MLCTIALSHDGAWFTMPLVPCKQVHGSGSIDDLRVAQVTHNLGRDIFAYSVEGRMFSSDLDRRTGERRDAEYAHNTEYVTICGVGPSKVPSCTQPFVIAAHDVGGGERHHANMGTSGRAHDNSRSRASASLAQRSTVAGSGNFSTLDHTFEVAGNFSVSIAVWDDGSNGSGERVPMYRTYKINVL